MLEMEENYASMERCVIDYIDKFSQFIFSISEKNIVCDELVTLYGQFVKYKSDLDGIFFKTDNFENPRSISLYYHFIYYYIEDYKLLKKLRKKLKMLVDKISVFTKNEKELTIA